MAHGESVSDKSEDSRQGKVSGNESRSTSRGGLISEVDLS